MVTSLAPHRGAVGGPSRLCACGRVHLARTVPVITFFAPAAAVSVAPAPTVEHLIPAPAKAAAPAPEACTQRQHQWQSTSRKCLLSQWRPFQPCAQRQRLWRSSSRQYLPSEWRQLQPSTQRQHLWQSTPRGFGRVRDARASRVRSTSACDSVQSCFLQCPRRLCNPSRGASASGRVHLASASRVATSCSDSSACARDRARRTSCGCNRSNCAGSGVHLAGLAVSVVPAPTVCTAPAPSLCLPCSWRRHQQCAHCERQWQSTLRDVCGYRDASTSSVRSASAKICFIRLVRGPSCSRTCSASASGRANPAKSAVLVAPAPEVCAAPAPVAE